MMKQKIIEVATELAQKYGLNAFSYQDISDIVGIKKASIHHYFPSKADLFNAILKLYITNFFNRLASYEATRLTSLQLLTEYINIFKNVAIQNDRLCLCFMYASDYLNLDELTQKLIKQFYLDNESWLANILMSSHSAKTTAQQLSRIIFSTLQGLLVRHRIINSLPDFDNLIDTLGL